MNKVRQTVNIWLEGIVAAQLPGWGFLTGDETDPAGAMNSVATEWIGGESGGKRPESRSRLVQVEVFVGGSNTNLAETSCDILLKAIGLQVGKDPVVLVPLRDYTAGRPGVATGRNVEVQLQNRKGWMRGPKTSHSTRFYVLTLVIDYIP